MTKISKTQRWLDLIAFLVCRRYPVSFEQVMEGVTPYAVDLAGGGDSESVRRKFERDKDELRALGIPIETVTYRVDGLEEAKGYRLRGRDFYLPYLRLVGEEHGGEAASGAPTASPETVEIEPADFRAAVDGLQAIASAPTFPFRAEARSALRKLTYDLGGTSEPALHWIAAGDPDATGTTVETLSDAVVRRKTVTFEYEGIQRNQRTSRRVRPHALLFKFNRWYLLAHDEMREASRTFRVSRMDEVQVNPARPGTPDYAAPEHLDLRSWIEGEPWDLPGDETPAERIAVRFHFPRSLWAERNDHGEWIETHEDGSQLRAFPVRQEGPFLRWLLGMEGEAEIVRPPEARARLTAMAAEVVALYGEPSG